MALFAVPRVCVYSLNRVNAGRILRCRCLPSQLPSLYDSPVNQRRPCSNSRSNRSSPTFRDSNAQNQENTSSEAERRSPPSPLACAPSSSVHGEGNIRRTRICPSAAILVDTDSSARISLGYCASTVHDTVQTHLRSCLVEQFVAPQLARDFSADVADAAEEAEHLAITALDVHRALHSIRQVAFSVMDVPRLQHGSWSPLWTAYRAHLVNDARAPRSTDSASAEEGNAGLMKRCHSHVRRLELADAQRQFGEVQPLFGPALSGTFFSLAASSKEALEGEQATTDLAGSAQTEDVGMRASEQAFPSSPREAQPTHSPLRSSGENQDPLSSASKPVPPFRDASLSIHSTWECFRVDTFIPMHVQLQAAVRHLLRERRPLSTVAERESSLEEKELAQQPQLSVRPLSVIALVVPDHVVDVYELFLSKLEHEQTELCEHAASNAGAMCRRAPVELLLFNSAGLVRACPAV